MATLNTQSFTQLVANAVSTIQGYATALVDLTIGSVLRAIVEANAAVVVWLQSLILQVLAVTRAATSNGSDVDSWMADFGLVRLAAGYASGQVTFARFTSTQQAVVPVGQVVQTADGTQQFTVGVDATNAAYNAALGGFVLAVGVSSINVTVTAVNPGTQANAVAGFITMIVSAIAGVDTVTNALPFTNGVNAETDSALRTRFIAYVASLSKATKTAIGYAVTSLQAGLSYTLVEDLTYGGASQPGYFFVVLDDGTGYPPSTLLTAAATAIDAVRPVTSTFAVFAPVVIAATITMTATVAAGYAVAGTKALAQAAVLAYVNGLALGVSLSYQRIAQVAFDASPGITDITALLLNGGTADLAATSLQAIVPTTVTVS